MPELDDLEEALEVTEVTTAGPSEPDDPEEFDGDQDDITTPDTPEIYGFMAKAGDDDAGNNVRGIKAAVAWGRSQVESQRAAFKGLCLMFVRMCFNVDPLYPDAITAWEEANVKHRVSMADAPRGHAGYYRGGKHGHVVLCLGNGLAFSNDTGAPGTINRVRLEDIATAWGYTWLGVTDDINGEVAPAPRKRRRITNRQWRLKLLRQARARARSNGNHARARRLTDWIEAIR